MVLLEFIEETMRACGHELASRFETEVTVNTKSDRSLVTEADLASEAIALRKITKFFPEDVILSEESYRTTQDRKAGQSVWIVDPLDGTTNFANRYPYFCVSIARGVFDSAGRINVTAGGIIEPLRNWCFLAERGGGAFFNSRPMTVHPERALEASFLVTGFYFTEPSRLLPEIDRFTKVASRCPAIRRDGAAALDLALVAKGVYDCFWENGLKIWDVAAGALLVEEAGGLVRNYFSEPEKFNIEDEGIIAGNRATVAEIAAII